MSELTSMFVGALAQSSALQASLVLGIVALMALRAIYAFKGKGTARKPRAGDRAWS